MGGWDHRKRGILTDRYDEDQGEKGNTMGEVENKGVGNGLGPLKKKS
jgi:hypothetical protein